MDRIRGLREYVKSSKFKASLGLPKDKEITYSLLAQGEYNINYVFIHPVTKEKLLLRVNTGSQMHLENQIEYEYRTLELLRESGRTPMPIYLDGSCKDMEYGIMVMSFLEGRALDYKTDLSIAAECLSDIHSIVIEKDTHLISPKNPIEAILEECYQMFEVYKTSPLAEAKTALKIEEMLKLGRVMLSHSRGYDIYRCCINTELNSSNFLINGRGQSNYIIDWEKPLFSDPAQDLGHFLAPTTTFWKTDYILSIEEIDLFIKEYTECVGGRFEVANLEERVKLYIPINCLRGVTWCAMAWIQYQSEDKLIKNEDTFIKLEQYLSEDFLDMIINNFLKKDKCPIKKGKLHYGQGTMGSSII